MHGAATGHVRTGALARPGRALLDRVLQAPSLAELCSARTGEGTRPHVACGGHRGRGSGIAASAYPMTAMAVAFSRSSRGTILSSVSAAVWW
jgi:hypothetical protein